MLRRLSEIIKPVLILTVLTAAFPFIHLSGQTPLLTGQVNRYAKVTGVGVNYVDLDDVTGFAAGDTAMVIQMAGGIIEAYHADPSVTGDLQDFTGRPGGYEILVITTVNTVSRRVTFTRNLQNTYNVAGKVQLVRVSSYSNAVVNSELSCPAWDSLNVRGGVLAFIVKGVLTLNAAIDVSGKGFRGGAVAAGPANCQFLNDSLRYTFYSVYSSASGFKGEGVGSMNSSWTSIYPSFAKGMGVTFTGGGGGNGHYSGGGGGSNYGAGATGDVEVTGCTFPFNGGIGGFKIKSTALDGGVFAGGGGGASLYTGAPTASSGGNGGGIVIILADRVNGNSRLVTAAGAEAAANTSLSAGAGGGGGGGSVIISTREFITSPVLSADGGKGGNTVLSHGAGGGGGGGLIWTRSGFPGATVTGGASGLNNGANPGRNGNDGDIRTALKLPLNGFLFNTIYSARTLNAIDSICQGMTPAEMRGSQPTGGSGTYTYQWEKSYDLSTWTPVTGGNGIDLVPSAAETDTVWFRRVVDDGVNQPDISNTVRIIVHKVITGNLVGSDTTLCYGQNPEELYPLNAGPSGGTGNYIYRWQQSPDNSAWSGATGLNSNPAYDPAAMTASAWYRRIVNSGACADTTATVAVSILPSLSGNTVSSDQTICQGTLFSNLAGTNPSGGASPSYTYLWKSSTDNVTWSPAAGVNSGVNYDPVNDAPSDTRYKRIVYSGPVNTCQDTSNIVRLICHPVIASNSVSAPQTICEGSNFATLTGTAPAGGAGAGTYSFQWMSSANGTDFTDISGSVSSDLPGKVLTASTWYRRRVTSSVCTSISNNLKVTVDPAITNYMIGLAPAGHDTIGTGQTPAQIQGTPGGGLGTYSYAWSSSPDGVTFGSTFAATQNYQPGALTSTVWYRRNITSGVCSVSSDQKITVLPQITGNTVSANQTVCNTTAPAQLTGSTPAGGDNRYRFVWEQKTAGGTTWSAASGTNNGPSYQPPALPESMMFRRTVLSGEANCCTSVSDPVTVTVQIMPENITAGTDRELFPYQFAENLLASFDGASTSMAWSVVESEGDPVFYPADDKTSVVKKLGFGENILRFTVENGVCKADPVDLVLTVPELVIPEGLTPNEDGINDYFEIDGLEFTTNELVIVNSGGAVVYRKKNYGTGAEGDLWDGRDTFGDPVPEGTYYYLLTITGAADMSISGYEANLSGFIVLRR